MHTREGGGRFRLRPDVLIEDMGGDAACVLDTKWKRLKADAEDAKNGILPADMYQLYAYAHRFDSPDNVLLYPAVPGAARKVYYLRDPGPARRIRVEFLNLARDLYTDRSAVIADLRAVLRRDGAGIGARLVHV